MAWLLVYKRNAMRLMAQSHCVKTCAIVSRSTKNYLHKRETMSGRGVKFDGC